MVLTFFQEIVGITICVAMNNHFVTHGIKSYQLHRQFLARAYPVQLDQADTRRF